MRSTCHWTSLLKRTPLYLSALCHLCGEYHRSQHAICASCTELMERIGPACSHCAIPLPNDQLLLCGACCIERPAVDKVITAYRFTEPLRTLIHAFKYESALYLSSFLSHLMLEANNGVIQGDCFIPVPMHKNKLRQRGFNQAAILALTLSRMLNKPCELFACDKIIETQAQAELSAKQRQSNLKKAFSANPLRYQHVVLIDDLYTTGATANELANTLKKNGVQHVDIWCCARTCHD